MWKEILNISLLMITIQAAVPLLFATLGELLTERSGVLNLGVEGVMAVGAVVGFTVAFHTNSVWPGVGAALLAGAFLGLIHSFLTITLQTNQVVVGLSMVIACEGMASFLGQRLGPAGTSLVGLQGPQLETLAFSGILAQDILTYLCFFLLFMAWIYIYKTRPGLELKAIGEKPDSADASGINVTRIRYFHTVVGAGLMAVGGAYLPLVFSPGWSEGMSGSRGWIAIGLVIVSRWNPLLAILAALAFGGISGVQYRLQAVGTTIPSQLLRMLPYVIAIIVLVIATLRERQQKAEPAALGRIYTRE